ncbi:predicted protein [Chaetoceros tenuissimus]|uniref:Uncharacterized protein n=1 Tax=Chaetoceros tenuissimus TaxID=426638 RepID=A0AAD3CN93_9STRA|nr:predicted protein [Chaetoceros tenuissimus]
MNLPAINHIILPMAMISGLSTGGFVTAGKNVKIEDFFRLLKECLEAFVRSLTLSFSLKLDNTEEGNHVGNPTLFAAISIAIVIVSIVKKLLPVIVTVLATKEDAIYQDVRNTVIAMEVIATCLGANGL